MKIGLVTPDDNYPLVSYLFSSIDVGGVVSKFEFFILFITKLILSFSQNLDVCNLHLFPEVVDRDEIHIEEMRQTVELFGDLPLLVISSFSLLLSLLFFFVFIHFILIIYLFDLQQVAGDFNMAPDNPGLEYLRYNIFIFVSLIIILYQKSNVLN